MPPFDRLLRRHNIREIDGYLVVQVDGIEHPVYLRHNTTDQKVFKSVFTEEEYKIDKDLDVNTIFDAGANIGLSAVYFANKYPDSRIFAVEAEKENYKVLLKNTEKYDNVFPIHAALWGSNEPLFLHDPNRGEWAFRVVRQPSTLGSKVRGKTMQQFIHDLWVDEIDILKIDIEGAEKDVFEANTDWLDIVQLIAIEIHDRFNRGARRAFKEAIGNDFPNHWKQEDTLFVCR